MLPSKIAFVDIETTGLRSQYDRIIEIGIVQVEDNEIVNTYHSLINPQVHLPDEITVLTGITSKDLENAPTFRQIKTDILEALIDNVFVAHNVRFDYSFLKSEFAREEISFSARQFCTVRLSRLLYPQLLRHNLDTIINTFNIECGNRHRALDDAKVLYDFYQHMQKDLAPEILEQAINKSLKKPSLPLKLQAATLDKLPEQPGVYLFYGTEKTPLYVGKSINIKNRVLSHFSADVHSSTEMNISQQIESIETITTPGELGALFLESRLIKEHLPLYNKKSRIKHELIALKSVVNKEGYNECILEPIKTIDPNQLDNFLGFFKSRKQAKVFLADMAKTHALCEKLLGLENTKGECFAYRLNRCSGACAGKIKPILYNMKFLAAFATTKIKSWPFEGPIMITERGFDGKKEHFIVDKWCITGDVHVDHEGNTKNISMEQLTFDLDIYRILRQYLKSPKNIASIKQLKEQELFSLTDTSL